MKTHKPLSKLTAWILTAVMILSLAPIVSIPANAEEDTVVLSITNTNGVTYVVPGTSTTYIIVVSNAGTSAVIGATVSNPLPAGVTSAKWAFAGATDGGAVTGPLSGAGALATTVDLPAGATVTFTFTVCIDPSATGTLTNTATVTPPAGVTDPYSANDEDSVGGQVIVYGISDIAVTGVVDNDTPNVGDIVTFTFTLKNNGPNNATNLSAVLSAMDAGLTIDSITPSAGSFFYTGFGSIGLWELDSLEVGETAILEIKATVEWIDTTLTLEFIYADQRDPDNTNNIDSVAISALIYYTITFDANGGSVAPTSAITQPNGKLASLPTPARSNYKFNGWFDAKTGGTKITTDTIFDDAVTIYAQWTYIGGSGNYTPSDPTPKPETTTVPESTTEPTTEIKTEETAEPDDVNEKVNNPFGDVKESDWYYDDVMFVYTNGLMIGTSTDPTLFSPNTSLTRSMIVTVLYRLAGSPDVTGIKSSFDDMPGDEWYSDAVKWAAENGIVNGYGDGKFGPEDNITRQDLAVILWRYLQYIKYEYVVTEEYREFIDENDIADYAKNAVQILNMLGIIYGKGNGIIDPQGEATRAEFAAMLHRFIDVVKQ